MIKVDKEFHEKIINWFVDTIVKNQTSKSVTTKIKHGGKYLNCSVNFVLNGSESSDYTCSIGDIVLFFGYDDLEMDEQYRRARVLDQLPNYYRGFVDHVLYMTGSTEAADDHREGFDLDTAFGLKFMFKKEPVGYIGMIKQNFESDKVLWAIEEHYDETLGAVDSLKSFTLYGKMVAILTRALMAGMLPACEVDPRWFNPVK